MPPNRTGGTTCLGGLWFCGPAQYIHIMLTKPKSKPLLLANGVRNCSRMVDTEVGAPTDLVRAVAPRILVLATVLLVAQAVSASGVLGLDCAATIAQWRTWDCSLTAVSATGEKAERDLWANTSLRINYVLQGEGKTAWGFARWVGGRASTASPAVYRFSTAFPYKGTWTWTTTCESGPCNEAAFMKSGTVIVTKATGPNRVFGVRGGPVRAVGHAFVLANGDPFLWVGDSAWAATMRALDSEWTQYLQTRATQGYSVVHLGPATYWAGATNRYQQRPFCDASAAYPSCDPPPPGYEFPLPNPQVRPNPDFWSHLRSMIQAANNEGLRVLVTGLMEPVGGNPGNPNGNATDQERYPDIDSARDFARYVAPFFDGLGVFLSPGFDSPPVTRGQLDLVPVISAVGSALDERLSEVLLTNHWSLTTRTHSTANCDGYVYSSSIGIASLQTASWLDFHMYQSGGTRSCQIERVMGRAEVLPQDLLGISDVTFSAPQRPVVNGEGPYDENNEGMLPNEVTNEYRARHVGWLSMLAGAAGYSVGVGGVWDWGACAGPPPNACGYQMPIGYRGFAEGLARSSGADHTPALGFLRKLVSTVDFVADEQWRMVANETNVSSQAGAFLRDSQTALMYSPDGPVVPVSMASGWNSIGGSAAYYDPETGLDIEVRPAPLCERGGRMICWHSNPRGAGQFGYQDLVIAYSGLSIPEGSWFVSSSNNLQVWEGRDRAESRTAIFGGLWSSSNLVLRDRVRISPPDARVPHAPVAARDGNGSFVVAWSDDWNDDGLSEVWVRLVGADGEPGGPALRLSAQDGRSHDYPSVGLDRSGRDGIVAWVRSDFEVRNVAVVARQFDPIGSVASDSLVLVDGLEPSSDPHPRVATSFGGSHWVAWAEEGHGSAWRLLLRRLFSGQGAAGPSIAVSSGSVNGVSLQSVLIDQASQVTVQWESTDGSGSRRRWKRGYSSEGVPQGPPREE